VGLGAAAPAVATAAAGAGAGAGAAIGLRNGLVLPPPLQLPGAMLAPPPVSAAAAAAPAGSDSSGTSSFSAALAARMGLGPIGCSSSGGASAEMSTAAAAAAIANTALPDASSAYGGLDGMAGFGLCSPPSLPGLSAAMSLPVSFDSEGYLRSISGDLDAAADMTLGAGAGCTSPCGFSA
jgi:hypothetical protein